MENVNNIPCSEIRKEAWNNLSEGKKWGKAAISMLVYTLLIIVISCVSKIIPVIGNLALTVITPVLAYGLLVEMIKLKNGEEYSYVDFFKFGFEKFAMVWKVALRVALKMVVPIIIIAVATFILFFGLASAAMMDGAVGGIAVAVGIVMLIVGVILIIPIAYKYVLVNLEIYYNPECEHSKELVEKAGSLMIGHRMKFFLLSLSFIGWALLCCFGFGIPSLWIAPYIQIASLVFYDKLINGENNSTTDINTDPIQ